MEWLVSITEFGVPDNGITLFIDSDDPFPSLPSGKQQLSYEEITLYTKKIDHFIDIKIEK